MANEKPNEKPLIRVTLDVWVRATDQEDAMRYLESCVISEPDVVDVRVRTVARA